MKRFFTFTDLMVITSLFCIFALLTPVFFSPRNRRPAYQKRCTNNLKQMGIAMQMYFCDGTETTMPYNGKDLYIRTSGNFAQSLDLEPQFLSCPAKRNNNHFKKVYVLQKGIEGTHLNDFENADSRIAMDGDEFGAPQLHLKGLKMNILFGDGHVETGTP